MHLIVLTTYHLSVLGLLYFSLYRLHLMRMAFRAHRKTVLRSPSGSGAVPKICIQCPCYNEPLVITGLLETVTAIRWDGPLEIQILDDSTDTTSEIISRWIFENPIRAINLRHLFRSNREGYKAGALNVGLTMTDAPYIAIFDTDFRPRPDYLEQLMPHFRDERVGVVQARWEFGNRHANLLTWLQSMILDIHFVLEQTARSHAGLFFNFNGTAGIWRRQALEDGGGWSAETVTEDLDLSYRAQLAGWRFVYTPHYAVESELPENITGFKSQQRRWTKGGMQVARRLLGIVLRSDEPRRVKAEALRHLTIGAINPIMIGYCLTQLSYLAAVDLHHLSILDTVSGLIVIVCIFVPISSFWLAEKLRVGASPRDAALTIWRAPLLMLFSVGMSISYAVAFVEGLFARRPGEFIRTPKGGARVRQQGLLKQLSGRRLLNTLALIEVIAGLGAAVSAFHFISRGHVLGIMAATMLAVSFILMGVMSILDGLGWELLRRPALAQEPLILDAQNVRE